MSDDGTNDEHDDANDEHDEHDDETNGTKDASAPPYNIADMVRDKPVGRLAITGNMDPDEPRIRLHRVAVLGTRDGTPIAPGGFVVLPTLPILAQAAGVADIETDPGEPFAQVHNEDVTQVVTFALSSDLAYLYVDVGTKETMNLSDASDAGNVLGTDMLSIARFAIQFDNIAHWCMHLAKGQLECHGPASHGGEFRRVMARENMQRDTEHTTEHTTEHDTEHDVAMVHAAIRVAGGLDVGEVDAVRRAVDVGSAVDVALYRKHGNCGKPLWLIPEPVANRAIENRQVFVDAERGQVLSMVARHDSGTIIGDVTTDMRDGPHARHYRVLWIHTE